jgi:hypothetical protein
MATEIAGSDSDGFVSAGFCRRHCLRSPTADDKIRPQDTDQRSLCEVLDNVYSRNLNVGLLLLESVVALTFNFINRLTAVHNWPFRKYVF